MLQALLTNSRNHVMSFIRAEFDARFFPHYSIWLSMALLTGLCLIIWSRSSLDISLGQDSLSMLLGVWLFLVGVRYQSRQNAMSAVYFILAYLILIAPLLGGATYLAIGAGYPLIDSKLAAFDAMIGFDWLAHTAWVNERPWATGLLTWTYNQLLTVMVATLVFLLATQRFERLREVILLMGLTAISGVFFVVYTPAVGAYAFYDPAPELISNIPQLAGRYHLPHFTALRDGTMSTINLSTTMGIVTFPSFHTITPVMCTWAVRGTWFFWIVLPLTIIMVISTLSIGGHYLADVLAGLVYCAIGAFAYAQWQSRRRLPSAVNTPLVAGE